MNQHKRKFFGASVLILAALATAGITPGTSAQQRIIPLRTNAKFEAEGRKKSWSIVVTSAVGNPIYVLSLEPDFDTAKHVVTLEFVLKRSGEKKDAPNLFDPSGKVHGLQAYDFAAADFSNGAQRSAFGEKRTITLKDLGLVVDLTVLKATVLPSAEGGYRFVSLAFAVEISNIGD